MQAYESQSFERDQHQTNTWYVVPADNKENARLIISEIVLIPQGSEHGLPRNHACARTRIEADS